MSVHCTHPMTLEVGKRDLMSCHAVRSMDTVALTPIPFGWMWCGLSVRAMCRTTVWCSSGSTTTALHSNKPSTTSLHRDRYTRTRPTHHQTTQTCLSPPLCLSVCLSVNVPAARDGPGADGAGSHPHHDAPPKHPHTTASHATSHPHPKKRPRQQQRPQQQRPPPVPTLPAVFRSRQVPAALC